MRLFEINAMLKFLKVVFISFLLASLSACSLFFGKTITEMDLKRNKAMARYDVGEDLSLVAKKLNLDGEAVVMATHDGSPVYLQIFATRKGIVIRHYDVNEYNFGTFDIFEGD